MTDICSTMPTKPAITYSHRPDGSFFQLEDRVFGVNYEVDSARPSLMSAAMPRACLQVRLNNEEFDAHRYFLPKDFVVGKEYEEIARGIYSFVDGIVRKIDHADTLKRIKKDAESLENEGVKDEARLFDQGSRSYENERGSKDSAVYDELARRLLTSISALTHMTSLSYDGLDQYRKSLVPGSSLEVAVSEVQPVSVRPSTPVSRSSGHPILSGLESYILSLKKAEPGRTDVVEKSLDYLVAANQGAQSSAISLDGARVVVDDFVPRYLKLLQDYDKGVRLPSNPINHAIGSAISGAIGG